LICFVCISNSGHFKTYQSKAIDSGGVSCLNSSHVLLTLGWILIFIAYEKRNKCFFYLI
jgi:uncharacterized membrane protein YGL010W